MQWTSILISFFCLLACHQNQTGYHSHEPSPEKDNNKVQKLSKSNMMDAILQIENRQNIGSQELILFFDQYMTPRFFKELAQTKSPEFIRALRKFHLKFILLYSDFSKERGELKELAKRYYDRLFDECNQSFHNCSLIEYLAHSIYASDVFSVAESIIPKNQRKQFIGFITRIGYPQNNPHIMEKRLNQIMTEIEEEKKISNQKLEELTNIITFLSTKKKKRGIAPLELLYQLQQSSPNDLYLRKNFEKVLILSLNVNNSPETQKIFYQYIQFIIKKTDLLKIVNSDYSNSLISWDSQTLFQAPTDWQLFYGLLGFLKSSFSGPLHDRTLAIIMNDRSQKARFLELVISYIYKKFIANIYRSHKAIGKVFQKKIEENHGKIDSIFFEFFSLADSEIAEIWLSSYRESVISIDGKLSRFYSAHQLKPINKVISHMEGNLRNLIGYPVFFILGYYAIKQGDFNIKNQISSGVILNMDYKLYFHDLFLGRVGQYFNSINTERGHSQDILLGFYISSEKKILQNYGLDSSFIEKFALKYIQKDIKFLNRKKTNIESFFGPSTLASNFLYRCNKLFQKDFNFTYQLHFLESIKTYFYGQVHHFVGTNISVGTSKKMADYLNFYNNISIKTNLSNDLATIRIDIGARINHLHILGRSLMEQGLSNEAAQIQKIITSVTTKINNLLSHIRETYKENLQCAIEHHKVERSMRLHFFEKEIEFLRSTYEALRILNESSSNDIAFLRNQYPEAFKKPYLEDLPQTGSFLAALNNRWKSLGFSLKERVSNYHQQVDHQIGFKKRVNGSYEFLTNRFEDRFRRLSYFLDSEKAGKVFPYLEITNIPENYDALIDAFDVFNPLFMSWGLRDNHQSSSDFVYRVFQKNHHPFRQVPIVSELNNTTFWRTVTLLLAHLTKVESFQQMTTNYEYWTYESLIKTSMKKNFVFMESIISELLKDWNLSEQETKILSILKAPNFLSLTPGKRTLVGLNYFVYDSFLEKKDLGLYDLFFNALVAYQLGSKPEFRTEIYNTGGKIMHANEYYSPLVGSWIPARAQDEEITEARKGDSISPEQLTIRRNIERYSEKNAKVVYNWNEANLFAINPLSLKVIRHDLYQPILTDHALTDVFVRRIQEKEESGQRKIPYRMDMNYRTDFHDNPDYIQSNMVSLYYDSRKIFHRNTQNIFVEAMKEPQKHGQRPQ